MNTKDNILDNLSEYSPRQLAEYVDKDVITWDDMRDTGDLTPSLRKAIEEQISQIAQVEDKDWERALAAGTKSAFQEYLSKYPSGKFTDAARGRISDLIREDNKIQIEKFINLICNRTVNLLRFKHVLAAFFEAKGKRSVLKFRLTAVKKAVSRRRFVPNIFKYSFDIVKRELTFRKAWVDMNFF